MKELRLKKDLKWGWNFIAAGVVKTESEWCEIIGRKGGITPNFGSDREYFEEINPNSLQ